MKIIGDNGSNGNWKIPLNEIETFQKLEKYAKKQTQSVVGWISRSLDCLRVLKRNEAQSENRFERITDRKINFLNEF